MINRIREQLRNELASPHDMRRFGSGWLSGVIGLLVAVTALGMAICMLNPNVFTVPELAPVYSTIPFRIVLYVLLIVAFSFAVLSLLLRQNKALGFSALFVVLTTTILGSFEPAIRNEPATRIFFGLDWFLLNVIFTGALFIPLERFFARLPDQQLFRAEWREDLFYYFVSSMLVQVLTFLSLWPSQQLVAQTSWEEFRLMITAQPFLLQFIEIMFLTDLVQYWVHRSFHRVPYLWRFHSVHHSARTLDWMAGARMHFCEILVLRGLTVIPMMLLGYSQLAVQAYIVFVYAYATFVHTNIRWSPSWLLPILVTPRYHHWHHGIEREAIDVNFAVHFPLLDRLFGTYHMPEDRWPSGYGIKNHPVPLGYMRQMVYPFRKR